MYSDYFLFVILCKILLNKPLINMTGVMLVAKEMFFKIENILREQGVLEKFEEENGEMKEGSILSQMFQNGLRK